MTKDAWAKRMKAIRDKYPVDDVPLSDEDKAVVLDFIEACPDPRQTAAKIRCGVKSIVVKTDRKWGKRHFCILRTDNTETDFTYTRWLRKPNPLSDFKEAARKAIQGQIEEFRRTMFSGKDILVCPIIGQAYRIWESEVDHNEPSFDDIVGQFIAEHHIDPAASVCNLYADNHTGADLIPDLVPTWQDYHRKLACLQIMSAKGHKVTHGKRSAPANRGL